VVTFRQQRPNPYAIVERGAIALHLYGIAEDAEGDRDAARRQLVAALERFGDGDIELILPTERSLELIAKSSTVDELLAALS